MDAISKAKAVNLCQEKITIGSAEVQLSPIFEEFRNSNDQKKFFSARKLYCEARATAIEETQIDPNITKKKLVLAISKKLAKKKIEALVQKEVAKKVEKVIKKQNKKTKKAIKLAKDTLGLDATKIIMTQLKELQKFTQQQTKAALKKNADTFTYPLAPVDEEEPTEIFQLPIG